MNNLEEMLHLRKRTRLSLRLPAVDGLQLNTSIRNVLEGSQRLAPMRVGSVVTQAQLSMIVSCALTDVVDCRNQPVIRYVKLVTRRRTNARERKMKSRELGSAPNVGRKLLVR